MEKLWIVVLVLIWCGSVSTFAAVSDHIKSPDECNSSLEEPNWEAFIEKSFQKDERITLATANRLKSFVINPDSEPSTLTLLLEKIQEDQVKVASSAQSTLQLLRGIVVDRLTSWIEAKDLKATSSDVLVEVIATLKFLVKEAVIQDTSEFEKGKLNTLMLQAQVEFNAMNDIDPLEKDSTAVENDLSHGSQEFTVDKKVNPQAIIKEFDILFNRAKEEKLFLDKAITDISRGLWLLSQISDLPEFPAKKYVAAHFFLYIFAIQERHWKNYYTESEVLFSKENFLLTQEVIHEKLSDGNDSSVIEALNIIYEERCEVKILEPVVRILTLWREKQKLNLPVDQATWQVDNDDPVEAEVRSRIDAIAEFIRVFQGGFQ